ncbi:MAG: hypothetical protein HDT43_01830 [Ruminococcaceae bacterium]|nr:hypothetical protein [Oscillospiraceae bacterium]
MHDNLLLAKPRSSDICSVSVSSNPLRDFEAIKQDSTINNMVRLGDRFGAVNTATGNAELTMGNLTYTITNYKEVGGFRPSTLQLLLAILRKFTANGGNSPKVVIPIGEYMEQRELKNRKEAIKKARADLKVLSSLKIEGSTPKSYYAFVNFADSGGIPKGSSDIIFTFGSTFYEELKKMPHMMLPSLIFKLNTQKYPHSVCFLQKISDMKHLNRGKSNEDIIGVQTLLDSSPFMPTYQEISEKCRHFKRDIIEPFRKNLDALSDALKWEYCYRANCPLEKSEAENLTYRQFSELKVHIMWNNYPPQKTESETPRKRTGKKSTNGKAISSAA